MMASLTTELIVNLVDNVSGKTGAITNSMQDMGRQAEAAGRKVESIRTTTGSAPSGGATRVEQAQKQSYGRMETAAVIAGRSIGGALTGATTAEIVRRSYMGFADLDRQIRRTAITANEGEDAVKKATATIRDLARETATPLGDVQKAFDKLIVGGQSWGQSLAMLPAIARTAKGSGAELEDLARTSDALAQSFDIKPDRIQSAFDAMVQGGKLGKFELKDMANYFDQLGPRAKAAGLVGEDGMKRLVAGLQVVRENSGTAGMAFTQMKDVLDGITKPGTLKQFEKAGVDLPTKIKEGLEKGIDSLTTLIEETRKITDGGKDNFKLGELFRDQQQRDGMRSLLLGAQQFDETLKSINEKADGSSMQDFKRVMEDSKAAVEGMTVAVGALAQQFGELTAKGITPAIKALNDLLSMKGEGWLSGLSEGVAKAGQILENVKAFVRNATGMDPQGSAQDRITREKENLKTIEERMNNRSKSIIPTFVNPMHGADYLGRFSVNRRIAQAQKENGVGRDFTLGGKGLSRTGLPVDRGGVFQEEKLQQIVSRALDRRLKATDTGEAVAKRATTPATMTSGMMSPTPTAELKVDTKAVDDASAALEALNDKTVSPTVSVLGIEAATTALTSVETKLTDVGGTTVKPTVDPASINASIGLVDQLLNKLRSVGVEANNTQQKMNNLNSMSFGGMRNAVKAMEQSRSSAIPDRPTGGD